MEKNKIAIDLSITNATNAGNTTYVNGLLEGFKSISDEFCIETINYKKIEHGKNKALKIIDTIRREVFWIHAEIPRIVKKRDFALLHSPSLLAPVKIKIPHVITVCDVYVLKNKKAFNAWHALSSDLILKNALFNVDKIISISHFTKSEIIDTFPQIPESKIETIHLGVEDIFCEINDDEKNRLKIKYQLPKQFILSVCTIEPRKNLKKVLQAFALIKDKIDHQFILVGSYGWKSNDLEEYISKLNITDRVKFLGFVPKNDLPGLYGTADAFVYASLYEGFGLPPLEAMACGCPVISSNCTSIPEVVGDAGLLVDPDSVEQISDAMLKVCDSKSLQNDLKKKGIDRSKKFTWENCAKRTIDVYKSVI